MSDEVKGATASTGRSMGRAVNGGGGAGADVVKLVSYETARGYDCHDQEYSETDEFEEECKYNTL